MLKKAGKISDAVIDNMLGIVDAIYHLSWQRSKVASHKVNNYTKSLSVYGEINLFIDNLLSYCSQPLFSK